MDLASIFLKPVDRPIEGVIKADDETGLQLEIEEYVLTREVARQLDHLLDAYLNYQGANGVWISGFFGSGKSHLLKMLALLLENRPVNGLRTLDMFLPKCADDPLLGAQLQKAVAIPSQSVLFNIDQKADVISKTQFDALLAVFVKAFDEMCGYYGKQGHIAQFERDLDGRGLLQPFREAFETLAGIPWERGREQALLESHSISRAYAQVTAVPEETTAGILDKYRAEYRVSIEDFAAQVQAYVERQGPAFRLNFFVDEVGQYIADNVKLMTNLQTIAESLATRCRGRAWIFVTAQEDMHTVVGEMAKQQSNDFSKIQARFANRMKLTSQDVMKVIEQRLLAKNAHGTAVLGDIYTAQQNNFRTLFEFADGAQTYRNFRDRDGFIASYPFIPYQYTLFQSAIQSLSTHNAFEGKHSSVGERSMLGVFQEVAVQLKGYQVGQLATFDLMFEGIRTVLKSQNQRSVLNAEQHLRDPFALKVLKALFLVKYVKEFKATARNVTVLMLNHFDVDVATLREQVEAALNLLETETYVQRNVDLYEYLTDEEKDVEDEIKHTEVDTTAVADELGKLIFDNVLALRKIRYDANGQDYAFSRKLDGRLYGREYELTVHVISPFNEHADNETILRAQALGRDELLVIMPSSVRLMRDLLLYKQTEKYVRQNLSTAQRESVRLILLARQAQNADRLADLRKQVQALLGEAQLVAGGQDLDLGSGDPQTRVARGVQALIARTYPHLRMLGSEPYSENDIGKYLQAQVTLYGDDAALLSEAELEIQGFVNTNKQTGVRTTMQSLVTRFERKPYGWYLAAIQCVTAKLLARGQLELRRDGREVADDELERALRNTHGHANLIVVPQETVTKGQLRALRGFFAEFFDRPPHNNEAKGLARETAAAFQTMHGELAQLREQARQYPFLVALDEPLARLAALGHEPTGFYYEELPRAENELLDMKEQILDPIRRFMSGEHRRIYDEARDFLRQQDANLPYLNGDGGRRLRGLLDDPHCYNGRHMQDAKSLLDDLRAQTTAVVAQERARALAALDRNWDRLSGTDDYRALDGDRQAALRQPFDGLRRDLERQHLIAVLRDRVRTFESETYPQLLQQMTHWAREGKVSYPTPGGGDGDGGGGVEQPRIVYVSESELEVAFAKPWLETTADVDAYLAALREALEAAIAAGKRVQI